MRGWGSGLAEDPLEELRYLEGQAGPGIDDKSEELRAAGHKSEDWGYGPAVQQIHPTWQALLWTGTPMLCWGNDIMPDQAL